jgi:hypothetical protein
MTLTIIRNNLFGRETEVLMSITAAFTCYALAVPIIVHPGDANDLLTTSRDTVNETISKVPVGIESSNVYFDIVTVDIVVH